VKEDQVNHFTRWRRQDASVSHDFLFVFCTGFFSTTAVGLSVGSCGSPWV
jgi:hypothetical protein